jgi:hypothetical protein
MAKNTGRGYRLGPVRGRSQFRRPGGGWSKRDRKTGRILNGSKRLFKGVSREK